MKRNWTLIRKILLTLEAQVDADGIDSDTIPQFSPAIVNFHFELLRQADLITIQKTESLSGTYILATSMTWQGYEFLEHIRQDTLWNKVKETIANRGASLSFELIKSVATKIVNDLL